ncbi:MAG: prepilin-type N-terminal cleavage/methylation domain-containing protein [Chitinispirillaceae bacterium]|nr:prepilin-type N-terminal cleavage/methylation domain-containing protein [Chitinispirillaceae bacterium]
MNAKKSHAYENRGFTFIEVVVVAAIVAVLAAVAIPIYIGYQNDARQRAVDELAQSAAAAADGFYRKTGLAPDSLDLNLFYDQSKFTVSVNSTSVTVTMIGYATNTKTITYK